MHVVITRDWRGAAIFGYGAFHTAVFAVYSPLMKEATRSFDNKASLNASLSKLKGACMLINMKMLGNSSLAAKFVMLLLCYRNEILSDTLCALIQCLFFSLPGQKCQNQQLL